ncbi:F-box protein At2g16365-like [Malania oleifera]|uniref:F-box protein At2g16365-like n=1 Tax=Malania oleifera TaxID=397392 RepID=UPI0025ADEF7D|nr:F-box protein At2g16365-like [Malania oleifera]
MNRQLKLIPWTWMLFRTRTIFLGFMGNQNTTSSQATVDSAREEVGDTTPNKDILDINQEVPAVPGATSPMDEGEPSISRTQSLDVEHLISQTEQHTDSKLSRCPDGAQEPELSSIWVKRLKLSAIDSFGHGTKSSKIEDISSHEKANKFLNKIMKRTRTDSEPSMGKRCGKEPMTQDQTPMFSSKDESASMVLIKKDREITLSHSWIQHWCHNQFVMPKKKPQAMVICEPQSSKAVLNEYQMEQYPSTEAMALMGKAMSGFCRFEFRKRGSSVVWNTEGF